VADILNIGTSALLSLQRAINTTGHNIANVNTEGFSRQRVEFAALEPQLNGAGFIGSGVTISGITRSYDQFLTNDVRSLTSSASGAGTLGDLAGRVDGILANPDTGLASALDGFFAALQDVSSNPGSLPERQVLLGQGQVLADRFQTSMTALATSIGKPTCASRTRYGRSMPLRRVLPTSTSAWSVRPRAPAASRRTTCWMPGTSSSTALRRSSG
jgi:flagellar hook-associated protein 1 FlgK